MLSNQLKHTGPELVYVAGVEGGHQECSWSTGLRQCQSWSYDLPFAWPGFVHVDHFVSCQDLPVSVTMACESKEDKPLLICASNPQISGKDSDWPCSSENHQFPSVQFSCSVVSDSVTCQASLSITNSQNLLKLMSIGSVMPSNHLTLCRPLLLPPSIFPSIRVFSNESALPIRWPKYWSFSFNYQSFQ